MTGALRSTPIQSSETLTRLQSMEERRDTRLLTQSAKFKRPENRPMHNRMYTPSKGRLKRSSFMHQARILERKDSELMDHTNKPIPVHCTLPAWKRTQFPRIRESIPGILKKGIQTDAEKKALTPEKTFSKPTPMTYGPMPTQTAQRKKQPTMEVEGFF